MTEPIFPDPMMPIFMKSSGASFEHRSSANDPENQPIFGGPPRESAMDLEKSEGLLPQREVSRSSASVPMSLSEPSI
jgi:hypothetical protein